MRTSNSLLRDHSIKDESPIGVYGVLHEWTQFEPGVYYKGETLNGMRHGHGEQKSPNGEYYKGKFENDSKAGQGVVTKDQNQIETVYGQGTSTVHGVEKWGSGQASVYIGDYSAEDGVKEGYGEHSFSDGSTYKGMWKNDKFNGKGIMRWEDGSTYDGEWRNGKMSGNGIYTDQNGEKTQGAFSNGSFIDNQIVS